MGNVIMNPQDDLNYDDGIDGRSPKTLSIAGVSKARTWSSAAWNRDRAVPLAEGLVEVSLKTVVHSAFEDDLGALEVVLVHLLRCTGLEVFSPPDSDSTTMLCNNFLLVINDEVTTAIRVTVDLIMFRH